MKTIALVFTLIILAGCTNKTENSVTCGMNNDDAELQIIISKQVDCPKCLLADVEKEIATCPGDIALNKIGFYTSYRAGQEDEPLRYYEAIASSSGLESSIHADAALMYRKAGEHDKSINSFRLSLKGRDDPIIRYEMAEEMITLGRYKDAIAELKKVVSNATPNRESSSVQVIGSDAVFDEASYALADVYVAIGETELAKDTYKNILSIYPDEEEASKALEKLGP